MNVLINPMFIVSCFFFFFILTRFFFVRAAERLERLTTVASFYSCFLCLVSHRCICILTAFLIFFVIPSYCAAFADARCALVQRWRSIDIILYYIIFQFMTFCLFNFFFSFFLEQAIIWAASAATLIMWRTSLYCRVDSSSCVISCGVFFSTTLSGALLLLLLLLLFFFSESSGLWVFFLFVCINILK